MFHPWMRACGLQKGDILDHPWFPVSADPRGRSGSATSRPTRADVDEIRASLIRIEGRRPGPDLRAPVPTTRRTPATFHVHAARPQGTARPLRSSSGRRLLRPCGGLSAPRLTAARSLSFRGPQIQGSWTRRSRRGARFLVPILFSVPKVTCRAVSHRKFPGTEKFLAPRARSGPPNRRPALTGHHPEDDLPRGRPAACGLPARLPPGRAGSLARRPEHSRTQASISASLWPRARMPRV